MSSYVFVINPPMRAVRQQLKLFTRQYNLYVKKMVPLQNNLIALTNDTFLVVSELLSNLEQVDGYQK